MMRTNPTTPPPKQGGEDGLEEQVNRIVGTAILKNDKNYAWELIALIKQRETEAVQKKIKEIADSAYASGLLTYDYNIIGDGVLNYLAESEKPDGV